MSDFEEPDDEATADPAPAPADIPRPGFDDYDKYIAEFDSAMKGNT
jgi:hypothetical protein